MQFLNPIALWGFAGITIPLAIHLLSRKEGKLMRVGSIRHLEESDSKKFKSIRMNEWLLLLLRCLLITWIVFLVSDARVSFTPATQYKWLLMEDDLANDARYFSLRDSLVADGFELRSLADGFPPVAQKTNSHPVDYWKLMEDLRTYHVDTAIIISYNYSSGYHGKREDLPDRVAWLTTTPATHHFLGAAYPVGSDSVVVREATSSSSGTSFTSVRKGRKEIPGEKIVEHDTLNVLIATDKDTEYDASILQASLRAIDGIAAAHISITTADNVDNVLLTKTDWLIWLPQRAAPVQTKIILLKPEKSTRLFRQIARDQWQLTTHLNEDIALNERLTIQLATILFPEAQDRNIQDRKTVDERILRPEKNVLSSTRESNTAPSSALWGSLILFTLMIERWVAYKRKQ